MPEINNILSMLALALWGLLFSYSVFIARDFFSPPVMFSGVLGVFYLDLFLNDHDLYIILIYISMLYVVALGTYPYIKNFKFNFYGVVFNEFKYGEYIPTAKLWMLAAPAILGQLYLIWSFGGLFDYLIAAKFGTREFHGLGPVKTIISSIFPLGMISFCYYITLKPHTRKRFFVSVFLYQATVVSFAVLTLSRGTLLNYFIIMMMCWSVLVKEISPKLIITALAVALAVASVYGVVRETFSVEGGDFTFGLEGNKEFFKTEWTEFGTFPLKKVLQPNNIEMSYGMTYLTLFTNFVPRAIWPDKPDPGGVVFTRDYAPGLYDEFNQYTTGLIPEAIINFGIVGGVLFGLTQLFALIYLACVVTIKIKKGIFFDKSRTRAICTSVVYAYFLWAAPFFLTGEFTNVAIGLLIKFIFICCYYIFLTKRIKFF